MTPEDEEKLHDAIDKLEDAVWETFRRLIGSVAETVALSRQYGVPEHLIQAIWSPHARPPV